MNNWQVGRSESVNIEEVDDSSIEEICDQTSRSARTSQYGRLAVNKSVLDRQAAKLKELRALGRKKQSRLVEANRKRQAMYFGQTQYKF